MCSERDPGKERQGQVGRYTLTPAEMGHRVEWACALEHGWVLVQCVPGGRRVLNIIPVLGTRDGISGIARPCGVCRS